MERIKLSEYVENLSDDAKKRYKLKLSEIFCEVDPYIDNCFESSVELPSVTYEQIYDFLVNSVHSSNSKQNAFKSLDAYHTVCAAGWLSSLEVKEWKGGVIVRGDVKPSQRSGILYKAWVALKKSGAVVSGHCTCMAGISEACNHVGALLYKCMQQKTEEISSTSQPNKWLPARKTVPPVPASELVFKVPKLDKCSSKILPLKQTQKSIKAAAGLKEPTEEEQEDFYLKLSKLQHNASILAIHQKFNKPFLPASQTKSLPKTVTSFADPNGITMTYDELIKVSMSIKDSYRVSADESRNLEECTQLQSKCKLWGSHRAGRVTASNFKAIIKTKVEDPSRSLLKRLCYPETCTFFSTATSWGCEHESEGIDSFLAYFTMDHNDVDCKPSGLVVNPKYPFLGASPDGYVTCSCHGKSLIEVKCPYRCHDKSLEAAVNDKDFCLTVEDGEYYLDKDHAYFYQVQCQLNVCEIDMCYFVVWSPNEAVCVEIFRDQFFFEECLTIVDDFVTKAILPEVIGQYFTRQPQKTKKRPLSESCSPNTTTTSSCDTSADSETYCICKGPDDGRRMICCDNENCSNGQWFHLKCMKLSMKKVPKGAWMCPQCRSS